MKKEVFLVVGGPCAGKGTQSFLLQQRGIKHFSAGSVLRQKYPEGTAIRDSLNRGELVNQSIINNIVEEELKLSKFNNIFFDGYPRDVEQALFFKSLQKTYKFTIKAVFVLNVSKQELLKRTYNRYICSNTLCERTFSEVTQCCNIPVQKRQDDNLTTFERRYDLYIKTIDHICQALEGPIYYVNGQLSKEEVFSILAKVLFI